MDVDYYILNYATCLFSYYVPWRYPHTMDKLCLFPKLKKNSIMNNVLSFKMTNLLFNVCFLLLLDLDLTKTMLNIHVHIVLFTGAKTPVNSQGIISKLKVCTFFVCMESFAKCLFMHVHNV